MRFNWITVGAAVMAAFILSSLVTNHFADKREVRWHQQVEAALEAGRIEGRQAAELEAAARAAQEESQERQVEIRERIRIVRETLPPDTIRDPIIDDQAEEIERLNVALDDALDAVDILQATNARLNAVLEARPKPRPAWLPEIGVGVVAGVTVPDLEPTVAAGVTATWRIRL